MFNAADDPLGLGLAQRARSRRQQFNADADTSDTDPLMSANPQVSHGSVMGQFERGRADAQAAYNPEWDKVFEALQEKADEADANGMKFKMRGLGNPAMESLNNGPVDDRNLEPQASWSARTKSRIYGPSMASLNQGR